MGNHNLRNLQALSCGLALISLLGGCVIRTYSVTRDRVDQQVTGNQGYLSGSNPAGTPAPKKITQRTTKVVEIELRSPVKVERLKEPPEPQASGRWSGSQQPEPEPIENRQTSDTSLEGNLGFVEGGMALISTAEKFDTYKVQNGDTLQKISSRPEIYGTSKKWMKIYEANKDKLKSPDKIRAGQELKIPRD